MPERSAILYVVATPIGNLEDFSDRGRRLLAEVALIAAEDTRHTARLLSHFGIGTQMISLHEHNERERIGELLRRLAAGDSIALVSDAGTPLLSDPGYALVGAARRAGIDVSPVPGPCAAIAALSVAGLPPDRFHFEGFLPARSAARRRRLESIAATAVTLVLYEAPHRLRPLLEDLRAVCGDERRAVIARELTKLHESVYSGTLAELAAEARSDPQMGRGELVVLLEGAPETADRQGDLSSLLETLLAELPLKQAVGLATRLSGARRNEVYALAVELQRRR